MFLICVSRHKEWRKIAKKERRRKIRKWQAIKRDPTTTLTPEEYKSWLSKQEEIEMLELESISVSNKEENEKWEKAEKLALENWQKILENNERLRQKQLQEEAKLKLEWELEKKRRDEEAQRLKQIEEETRKKQKIFMNNLEQYLNGDAEDPPEELLFSRETRPNGATCPFFLKTACCRFGDQCSRNHCYPGISKILLATNFFSHFGLESTDHSEYDTDVMLEYEDTDTYKDFKNFFNDVLPEFEKYGKVVQFKVCNNYEKHLRGNTYIEYRNLRCAVAAYRGLHSRWYGGRQLSLQFCNIQSWARAICGLQPQRRCPKGHACNFLHVFRNPGDLFSDSNGSHYRSGRSPHRSWRWSESPERESPPRRKQLSSRSSRHRAKDRSPIHKPDRSHIISRRRHEK